MGENNGDRKNYSIDQVLTSQSASGIDTIGIWHAALSY